MPDDLPVARQPRADTTAADAASLERMGRLDEQPVPAPAIHPFLDPDLPPAPADES
jgi:hypothetical protein